MCENTTGVVSATFVETMPSVFPFSTQLRQNRFKGVAARYRRYTSIISVNERVEATLVASVIKYQHAV